MVSSYSTDHPRVQQLVAFARERCAGMEGGPADDNGDLRLVMEVCGMWVWDEDAYRQQCEQATDRQRAVLTRVRRPISAHTMSSVLTAAREVLAGEPWGASFKWHQLTARRTMQQEHNNTQKGDCGYLIMNFAQVMATAAALCSAPDISYRVRLVCLGLVSGLRGCELHDPSYKFTDGGDGYFVSNRRAKGGKENHRARLWCNFDAFARGVELLRRRSIIQLKRMQKKLNFAKVEFMRAAASAHQEHFGAKFTYHKVREIYAAMCFHEEHGHLSLHVQCQYMRAIRNYLGHNSSHSSWCYEYMKHSPDLAEGVHVLAMPEVPILRGQVPQSGTASSSSSSSSSSASSSSSSSSASTSSTSSGTTTSSSSSSTNSGSTAGRL
jgi:hypothetical protein